MIELLNIQNGIKEARYYMENAKTKKEYYQYRNILTDFMADELLLFRREFSD